MNPMAFYVASLFWMTVIDPTSLSLRLSSRGSPNEPQSVPDVVAIHKRARVHGNNPAVDHQRRRRHHRDRNPTIKLNGEGGSRVHSVLVGDACASERFEGSAPVGVPGQTNDEEVPAFVKGLQEWKLPTARLAVAGPDVHKYWAASD